MELLSPCGNFETFIAVVNSGADAVYLAGSKYGARAYAENFTDDEIIEAIKYAHLLSVKVYLTVNTLIKEKEWDDVISYIKPFYEAGLDACIVQDIGLIYELNRSFPNMECHVSTQSFVTSKYSAKFFKDLGVTRIVLARELTLPEVKAIKEECSKYNIEIEAFIHGAMCYSYSGQCLFSSCLGGRSGNRGRCAGPCRLEYEGTSAEGHNKAGYLLSMKDQCALEILPKLIEAGVDSFKIEGRMKRPEYAAFVTSMYRKYIDLYKKAPNDYKVSKEDLSLLKSFYMRSEIGTGYYLIRNGKEMISILNPAYSKTSEDLIESVKNDLLTKRKTLPVSFYINATVGEPFSATASINDIYVYSETNIVSESINRPVSLEDIHKHFTKLGDTVFSPEHCEINLSKNAFISVGEIKNLRRKAINELESEIILKYNKEIKKASFEGSLISNKSKKLLKHNTIIEIITLEQLNECAKYYDRAYIAIDFGLFVNNFEYICNLSLSADLILNLPFVVRNDDVDMLKEYIEKSNFDILVNNIEELYILNEYYSDKTIILGPSVYQWNKHSVELLSSLYDGFVYPYELSKYEINDLGNEGFLTVYGKVPLMQSANCIQKTISQCLKNKGERFVYIKDRKNYNMPVSRNCYNCSNTIYNAVPTFLHDEVMNAKIINKVISFTDENAIETKNILYCFMGDSNKCPNNFTKGYWKRGVD